jgi:hypothetical protein
MASILSFVLTPESGWKLTPVLALVLTLFTSLLLFLALSVLAQGWDLFINRYTTLEVRNIQKSKDFGGDLVFILSGHLPLGIGTVVDIHRRLGDLEVPFALVEVVSQNDKGHYQATPFTIVPAHLRDYNAGRFTVSDLIAHPFVTIKRIREVP